jgi:hypothetical protein
VEAPDQGESAGSAAEWVPARALVILTVALVAALLITVVVCWVVWHTPQLTPVDVAVVPQA